MKIHTNVTFSVLAILLAMPLAYADRDADRDHDDRGHHEGKNKYEMELMPLNNSGVEAEVEIKLKGNMLTISIEASGLEAGKPHPQHIHGHGEASINASCPGIEADVDGDGLISVQEGVPSYGPIMLPLTPFNLVDADGELEYQATFSVDPDSLAPLHKRTIVLHGMTVNGQYIPSLPVACGEITRED